MLSSFEVREGAAGMSPAAELLLDQEPAKPKTQLNFQGLWL